MNADDYYRIRALAQAGRYSQNYLRSHYRCISVFALPDVDLCSMHSALYNAFDWNRFLSDLVNRILSKLGSFADDWYFGFQDETGLIIVSQPGLEDNIDSCDFARVRNIVLRLVNVCVRHPIFEVYPWSEFFGPAGINREAHSLEHGTHPRMSDAQFATTVRANLGRVWSYGKFPSLRYIIDHTFECPDWFELDDLIALHRAGKYTRPGRRVDLSWLQYAD